MDYTLGVIELYVSVNYRTINVTWIMLCIMYIDLYAIWVW